MKKLHFDYCMQINYSQEVSKCNFTIKCIPQSNERQKIEKVMIDIDPCTSFSRGFDGLGNAQIYGLNSEHHTSFYFQISGDAIVGLSDYEECENDDLTMIFNHPYGMNVPGKKIKQYQKSLLEELKNKYDSKLFENPEENALTIAQFFMHCLNRDFQYKPCATTIDTTAEEAFDLGCGVCQDYAHIFIALMHLMKIPARYVTGLIIGEGASHAWVEILQGKKWYGLDPTNDKLVFDEHIKIGVGRDAHDCKINRGIMKGGGLHTQDIQVVVTKQEL